MNASEMLSATAQPGPLLARNGEALFAEPWQAQIVAMAAAMVEKGRFSANDWSNTLGAEIRLALANGAPDNAATYYQCVLAAFEALVKGAELASAAELKARKEAWIDAYENTPHGQPVVLGAAHHHDGPSAVANATIGLGGGIADCGGGDGGGGGC